MGRFLAIAAFAVLLGVNLIVQLHGGDLASAHHAGIATHTSTLSTAFRPFPACNGVPTPC